MKISLRSTAKIAAELIIVAAVLLAFSAYQSRKLLPVDAKKAPALLAQTLDGTTVDLHAGNTTRTLVYFFAPWCGICAASSGNINLLRKIRSAEELQIVLVALDWENPDQVHEYAERHELSVPVLLGSRQVASDWNIYAFPTYYMLDGDQRIAKRDLGYTTLAGLWWRSLNIDWL